MGKSLTSRRRRVGRHALNVVLVCRTTRELRMRTYHMIPTEISMVLHMDTS
jgi:hypothetical protein